MRTGPAPQAPIVYILPLGERISAGEIDYVRESLSAFYDVAVLVLPRSPMPVDAWYAPRHRFRAERILDYLSARIPSGAFRILGLTGDDISTSNHDRADWGMLGLADYSRPVCVVSAFRCGGTGIARRLAWARMGKVAVHEIGHTLGLPHCPDARCIMQDARGRLAGCDRARLLCDSCRAALIRGGSPLRAEGRIPWIEPPLDRR